MPHLHLLSPDGLRKAIESADYLAHVVPEHAIDIELRIKLDTYHADLQSEAERRAEDQQRARVGQAPEETGPGRAS